MADKDLWTTFEKTGSVADYLRYKGICVEEKSQKAGEGALESISNGDRHDPVSNAHGGI